MVSKKQRVTRIVGVGADGDDGHIRMTNGQHYRLLQGSELSHARMQEWCDAIQHRLDAMNKRMDQLSPEEFMALAKEAAPRS